MEIDFFLIQLFEFAFVKHVIDPFLSSCLHIKFTTSIKFIWLLFFYIYFFYFIFVGNLILKLFTKLKSNKMSPIKQIDLLFK